MVATPSFHQARDRASHQAIGVPTMRRITVVSVANAIVRRMAIQISEGRAANHQLPGDQLPASMA